MSITISALVTNYNTWKDLVEARAIADNAYAWYQTHNLSVQTQIFATHLTSNIVTQLVTRE